MADTDIRVTVIGGSGFVGTNLCRVLAVNDISFNIIDVVKSRAFPDKTLLTDIRDQVRLLEAECGETIVHLAAVHRDDVRDKSLYHDVNVTGTQNVTLLAKKNDVKTLIFTSSVAVYGFAPPETDETAACSPFNAYGATKLQAEEVLHEWRKDSEQNALMIVRPTVIFGEGNRGNVYNLLNQIASGRFVMIGNGNNRKSMAYVKNVANFLSFLIRNPKKNETVNYVDKPDMMMNELVTLVRSRLLQRAGVGPRLPYLFGLLIGYLADILARILGRTLPVSSIRIKKFCSDSSFSTKKADLGFEAPFSLEEGIANTLKSEFIEPDENREIFFTE